MGCHRGARLLCSGPRQRAGITVMLEFIERSFVLDTTGWFVLSCIGFAAFIIVSQMFDDMAAAIICTPILVLWADIGNQSLRELCMHTAYVKAINTGVGMSAGLLATSIVLVTVLWTLNVCRAR